MPLIACARAWRATVHLTIGAATTLVMSGLAVAAPLVVPDTMGQRLAACIGCHGDQGRATSTGYYPRIAGKPAGYLYNQLVGFQTGRRRNPQMSGLLDHLSADYLREIAGYFADQDLPSPSPRIVAASPALERGRTLALSGDADRNLPACAACHGPDLTGVAPFMPGVLGLSREYLSGQIGAWRSGLRRAMAPDCMATVVAKLSPQDIDDLATWLSSKPVPFRGRPTPATDARLPIRCGATPP